MTTPTKLCSKNVCIICSSVNKHLLNILNTRCNNLPLKVVLLSILNINVDISDNIMICRSCVDKIRTKHTKVINCAIVTLDRTLPNVLQINWDRHKIEISRLPIAL